MSVLDGATRDPSGGGGGLTFPVGDIDETEFGYLDNLTAAIQTQLDGKAASGHNHDGVYQPVGSYVTKVGTPADNQIGVWTGDGTIEGTAALQWSQATNDVFTVGDNGEKTFLELQGSTNARLDLYAGESLCRLDWNAIGLYFTDKGATNYVAGMSDDGFIVHPVGSAQTAAARLEAVDTGGAQARLTYTAGSVYTDLETNSSGETNFVNTSDDGVFTFKSSGDNDTIVLRANDGAAISEIQTVNSTFLRIGANGQNRLTLSYRAATFADDTTIRRSTNAGITASVTQTQGEQALLDDVNEVATVDNANDVVTLPPAVAGQIITVINNGANTLQIYPASGDDLGAGVDTSTTVAAGSSAQFVSYDSTHWVQLI